MLGRGLGIVDGDSGAEMMRRGDNFSHGPVSELAGGGVEGFWMIVLGG